MPVTVNVEFPLFEMLIVRFAVDPTFTLPNARLPAMPMMRVDVGVGVVGVDELELPQPDAETNATSATRKPACLIGGDYMPIVRSPTPDNPFQVNSWSSRTSHTESGPSRKGVNRAHESGGLSTAKSPPNLHTRGRLQSDSVPLGRRTSRISLRKRANNRAIHVIWGSSKSCGVYPPCGFDSLLRHSFLRKFTDSHRGARGLGLEIRPIFTQP